MEGFNQMEGAVIYFAYGSNLDLEHLAALGVKIYGLEPGIIKGWKLVFNVVDEEQPGAGYANIIPDKQGIVEGLIIETDEDSVKKIDVYEGFPWLYKKENLIAFKSNEDPVPVMVYTGNIMRTKSGLLPTREHLDHILNGERFLSKEYFQRLKEIR